MVIDMQVPLNIVTTGGGKYEGLVNLGTPPQQFEFSVDNGVLAFTMVADEQPIICDGFSSTGDAKVNGVGGGSSIETDEGNDAGAAAGAVIAVIVARRVGSVVLVVPQRPTHSPPAARPLWALMVRPSACASTSHVAPSPIQLILAICAGGYWYMKKGAAPDKGAPMPPPPGTAPGWQLRRFKTAVYIRLGAPCAPELGHSAYLRPMARLRTPERSPGRLASGGCRPSAPSRR